MVIERCFHLIHHFDHLKTTGQVRNHVFSSEEYYKRFFFYLTYPQGVLFCQNKSQLSNLQNDNREMFLFNPPFWPFKNHWTCQKSCFLIRRVLKSLFFIWLPPRGSCFAKIRVSCQTFKMVIERCFYLIPHYDPLKATGHVRNHVFSSEEC